MSHSKPAQLMYTLLTTYLERQYNNPLLTKAVTSSIIAAIGNVLAQKLSKVKSLNPDSIIAFLLFGLFLDGPMSYYFHMYIRLFTKNPFKILLIEKLLYTPIFQALVLYMLNIFEGKTHKESYNLMKRIYMSTVHDNIMYLTLPHLLNVAFTAPMLRFLVRDLINFVWIVYFAHKRANALRRKN